MIEIGPLVYFSGGTAQCHADCHMSDVPRTPPVARREDAISKSERTSLTLAIWRPIKVH